VFAYETVMPCSITVQPESLFWVITTFLEMNPGMTLERPCVVDILGVRYKPVYFGT
jgi:hypothetical protein